MKGAVHGTHTIHGIGVFTYVCLIFMVNASKYTIHGSYGVYRGLYYLVIYGGGKNHQTFQVPKMVQKTM